MPNSTHILTFGKFPLGQIVATPGALASCHPPYLSLCLTRHVNGDWGNVCADDAAMNEQAVERRERILSAYPIDPARPFEAGNKLWIITERDRSVTTFLLPEEY